MVMKINGTQLYDRILAALYGGVIGDAMGAPTENKNYADIDAELGWVADFDTGGTDDTILRDILVRALVDTGGYATLDDWAARWLADYDEIFGAKQNRFFISVLHTAFKLREYDDPRVAALGNVPCSSAAMGIVPVGMVNASNPRQAAHQAYNLASLIDAHNAGVSQDGAAAMAAAMAAALAPDASVQSVLEASSAYLYPRGAAPMARAIERSASVAAKEGSYARYRAYVYDHAGEFFAARKKNALETVPITLGLLLLAEGDFGAVIPMAANFGRDTDTMAAMAGALAGALGGMSAAPSAWIDKARRLADADQEALAEQLTKLAIDKRKTEARLGEDLDKTLSANF